MNLETEYRLKRIAENLWLDQNERDRLFLIYANSNPDTRDGIVNEIEKQSKLPDFEVRYELKKRIRKS